MKGVGTPRRATVNKVCACEVSSSLYYMLKSVPAVENQDVHHYTEICFRYYAENFLLRALVVFSILVFLLV